MNEYKKVVTNLDAGSAAPISVSKENALNIASKQEEAYKIIKEKEINNDENIAKAIQSNSYIQPKQATEEDIKAFQRINDFIVVEEKKKTNPKTLIIMVLILFVLIMIFVIFELPMLREL